MRSSFKLAVACAAAAVSAAALAMPASAECKKFGFLVNDYGKDGPTKDAKALLDKSIASQMAERGIKDYKIGTKSVKCELFLNFIVFDEHTCTAEATACWGGSALPKGQQASNSDDADGEADKPKAASEEKNAKSKSKEAAAKKPVEETPAEPKAKAKSSDKTAALSEDGSKAEEPKSEAKAEKADESKPEKKAAEVPAKSQNSHGGVADPVKPRIASAAAPTNSASPVVTGSVTPPKKKEPAKVVAKKEPKLDEPSAGYPTPQAPAEGQ